VPENDYATKRDLEAFKETLLERIEKTETTLLREFRKWAISFESRFRANEVLIGGFNERLIALEERVGDIERKPGA
jgi:hypothetical protein